MGSMIGIVKYCIVASIAVAVFSPIAAYAQQPVQNNNGGLQQQSPGTQNTGTLHNDTVPVQKNNNGDVLNQPQPGSLGVVSSPNQTKPAVSVGASDTTIAPLSEKNGGGNSWAVIVVAFVALCATIFGLWSYKHTTQSEIYEAINPKSLNSPSKKLTGTKKTSKSSVRSKKKKKKTLHR